MKATRLRPFSRMKSFIIHYLIKMHWSPSRPFQMHHFPRTSSRTRVKANCQMKLFGHTGTRRSTRASSSIIYALLVCTIVASISHASLNFCLSRLPKLKNISLKWYHRGVFMRRSIGLRILCDFQRRDARRRC